MLKILRNLKDNYSSVLTGDESYIFYFSPNTTVFLAKGKRKKFQPIRGIHSKKLMLTVFWNPDGFHLIDFLPERTSMNAKYFIDNVIRVLKEKFGNSEMKILLHFDNCSAHTAKSTSAALLNSSFVILPHPPYSPDLAPSDFFLFGYLKSKLRGFCAKTADELKKKIRDVLEGIGRIQRQNAFSNWIKRLRRVVYLKGNYFYSPKILKKGRKKKA
jgi:transposase